MDRRCLWSEVDQKRTQSLKEVREMAHFSIHWSRNTDALLRDIVLGHNKILRSGFS